jgi:hypothetical protein
MTWRYVDNVPSFSLFGSQLPGVENYNVMDIRLAWTPRPDLELAVVGRSLLDAHHPEYGLDPFLGSIVTEVQSEVYGMITCRY